MSIRDIFTLIENKSHNLRKKNPKADGQKFWQPIKNILSEINIEASSWKKIKKNNKIMLLPEYVINGYGNQEIIEINHFLIQTVRIPLTEKPTIRKIIQIALNIGQFTGSGGKKKKWMNIDNYLSKENIKKIDSKIPKNLIKKF